MADFIGSTTALLKYSQSSAAKEFIVGTESGIIHQMKISSPDKIFIPAPPETNCACNDCPYMKLNTLEKLYLCMEYETPEILMSADLLKKGRIPIDRMLEISRQYNL
jgi:quinolinate synthase